MAAVAEGHQRRSSLSEALEMRHGHGDNAFAINAPRKDSDLDLAPESPFEKKLSEESSQMGSVDTTFGVDLHVSTRKSGVVEAEKSPFTPDFPVYELCTDSNTESLSQQQLSGRKSSLSSGPSTLGTVPEDSPPPPDDLTMPAINTSVLLSPDKLRLKQVKTPRKSMELDGSNPFARDFSMEDDQPGSDPNRAQRMQPQSARSDTGSISSCIFKQPSMPFNPFELERTSMERQETGSRSIGDEFFPMEVGSQKSQTEFGSGMESLSLEQESAGHSGAETEEHRDPMPRDTLTHLLATIESMIAGIEDSHEESLARTHKTHQRLESVRKLEADLNEALSEEADVDARLRVLHSQLEAHLLSNLDQEDNLRVSGERLKMVKEEIKALDVALSTAEEQRRDLERQLAESKASKGPALEAAQGEGDAKQHESDQSNYDSAWETSESEAEMEDVSPESKAVRRTLSEDNQAKMSLQGTKGGSWITEGLRNRPRRDELPAPLPLDDEDVSTPRGGGMSHFQLPTTAAEFEKSPSEELTGPP